MKHLLLLPVLFLGSCAPSLETQCQNLSAVLNKQAPDISKKEDVDAFDALASYNKNLSAEIQTLEIIDQKLKPFQLRLVDNFKQTGEGWVYQAESVRKAKILLKAGDIPGSSLVINQAAEKFSSKITLAKETIELIGQVYAVCPKKPKP